MLAAKVPENQARAALVKAAHCGPGPRQPACEHMTQGEKHRRPAPFRPTVGVILSSGMPWYEALLMLLNFSSNVCQGYVQGGWSIIEPGKDVRSPPTVLPALSRPTMST